MPRVSGLLLLLAFGSGCGSRSGLLEQRAEAKSAPTAVPSTTAIVPGAAVEHAVPERLVRITSFDCDKLDELPGVARPSGPVGAATGIRAWHGGGPNGSNWNVGDLRCVIEAATDCRRGKLAAVARVGRSIVGKRQLDVAKAGPFSIEMAVAESGWRRNLEEPARQVPYRTALFRATISVDCKDPQADLRQSRYPEVGDDATFVAGFASGE
jgi:hypothetical protein